MPASITSSSSTSSSVPLQKVIEELDEGMRKQFKEKFEEIHVEFDRVFKELFGGGKGTLELVEDEDVIEAGIRIISQPPGKNLLQSLLRLNKIFVLRLHKGISL